MAAFGEQRLTDNGWVVGTANASLLVRQQLQALPGPQHLVIDFSDTLTVKFCYVVHDGEFNGIPNPMIKDAKPRHPRSRTGFGAQI